MPEAAAEGFLRMDFGGGPGKREEEFIAGLFAIVVVVAIGGV